MEEIPFQRIQNLLIEDLSKINEAAKKNLCCHQQGFFFVVIFTTGSSAEHFAFHQDSLNPVNVERLILG